MFLTCPSARPRARQMDEDNRDHRPAVQPDQGSTEPTQINGETEGGLTGGQARCEGRVNNTGLPGRTRGSILRLMTSTPARRITSLARALWSLLRANRRKVTTKSAAWIMTVVAAVLATIIASALSSPSNEELPATSETPGEAPIPLELNFGLPGADVPCTNWMKPTETAGTRSTRDQPNRVFLSGSWVRLSLSARSATTVVVTSLGIRTIGHQTLLPGVAATDGGCGGNGVDRYFYEVDADKTDARLEPRTQTISGAAGKKVPKVQVPFKVTHEEPVQLDVLLETYQMQITAFVIRVHWTSSGLDGDAEIGDGKGPIYVQP
jgi:hypothetical protein